MTIGKSAAVGAAAGGGAGYAWARKQGRSGREAATTAAKGALAGGAGGLAVGAGLARRRNRSAEGAGAHFVVFLPFKPAVAEAQRKTEDLFKAPYSATWSGEFDQMSRFVKEAVVIFRPGHVDSHDTRKISRPLRCGEVVVIARGNDVDSLEIRFINPLFVLKNMFR